MTRRRSLLPRLQTYEWQLDCVVQTVDPIQFENIVSSDEREMPLPDATSYMHALPHQ